MTQKKKALLTVVLLAVLYALPLAAGADVNYDFVKKDGGVESKIGPMVEKILVVIIGVGIGVSIISIGVGACKFFGRVFKMDKEDGIEKVKAGGIGVLVFGVFFAIIETIFSIAGI